MKNNRNTSSFEGATRRKTPRLPILIILLVVLLFALLAFLWARGGEQPQRRVEIVIPAEKLGQ